MTDWPPDDGEEREDRPATDKLLDSPTVTLTTRELAELIARAVGELPAARRDREARRQAEAQCERMRGRWLEAEGRLTKLAKMIKSDEPEGPESNGDTETVQDMSELVGALGETVSALDEAESGWDSYQIKKLLRRWQDRIRQEGSGT